MNIKPLFLPLACCVLLLSCSHAFAESCVTVTCHPAIAALKQPHHPVKDGDCLSCHQQKVKGHPVAGGKSFELAVKGGELCSQCHEAKGEQKVVHSPVKEGDCISCHKPHGGSGPFLLDEGDDQSELCLGCHDSAPFRQRFTHGPVAVGSCTRCHDPHEAAEKALLKDTSRDLCLKCHVSFQQSLKTSPVVHPPVRSDPCTSCHDPHGSSVNSFLRKKMPDICVECHAELGKKMAGVKVPHKPLQQEAGCGNCHSTHFAEGKGLLAAAQKEVCLSCHGTGNLGTPPLKNIAKELEGKKYLHGPIRKGECTACHDPHGSNNFRMLRGGYPAELYATYTPGLYDGCLLCHQKNMLRYADTTIYTNFRNGNRNLHFVHVVGKKKGRSCRSCHEPHASNGEKLISKEGVNFGNWKIPINFQITATGGGCAPGCHRQYKYDREKPENYRQ